MTTKKRCSGYESAPFDGYEIHGLRRSGKGKDRCCEQVPDDEAQFWSLYGHIPGQGVECIGDFITREHAEEVYARITGRRFTELKKTAGTMPTNHQRALSAERAIFRYGEDLPESNLIDFLADAMHWCDREGRNFHNYLAQACRHYGNELNDQQHYERRMS
jgi:hypothetical protein